jgi:hypothetical protein
VAFYGVPSGPELGVLGAPPREMMVDQLRGVAAQYQGLGNDRLVLPAFHMVTTIADPFPGDYGRYSHWVREETIAEWVETASQLDIAVILDIQPGYADLQLEIDRLEPFLYEPHVHLAVDPEFLMHNRAIPGREVGYMDGTQINAVQRRLEQVAVEIGLNKVLIIHQFDTPMVREKAGIEDFPHVELVMDADGFGSPEAKIGDYRQYAAEPGFEYGGFKLFFGWDAPLMTPAGVMDLDPLPAVIIYQ